MAEPLSNPLNDRVLPYIEPPPHRPLSAELLFPQGPDKPPNYTLLRNFLKKEGKVSKEDALRIIIQCIDTLKKEKSLIELKFPVTVVGDIHGQFYDLLKLLEMVGDVAPNKFLFLGDYVDRGFFSVEVILLLYSLKINFPNNVFLLRGNHECRQMTSHFNFRMECLHKYDLEFYETVCDSFCFLPLGCVINKKFLAVHGGISPELGKLEDINKLNRYIEPPSSGLICDILWSDPVDDSTGEINEKFQVNDNRGCSYYFGNKALSEFLKRNKLLTIIRAHEVQLEGYKMHTWNGDDQFPVVVTIFSAPNYCDVYNNKGAVIRFDDGNMDIQQFSYSGHPYILPDYKDLFSWSIPFVIEKILQVLTQICQPMTPLTTEVGGKVKELQEEIKDNKGQRMRKKIKAMSKMLIMFKTIREEEETIMQLKGLCPGQKIPPGLIQQGKKALENALTLFNSAKSWDSHNEKRPSK